MKYLLLIFVFLAAHASAQSIKYDLSAPVDIPPVGWNKLLLMKNGNTLLFHFEPNKQITVKVFDSAHKEIVTQKHTCNSINLLNLQYSTVEGIYDINNEAVLFITQESQGIRYLARIRIDGTTGKIINEAEMVTSKSHFNKTICKVMKHPASDNYAVLCYRNIIDHPEEKIEIKWYDSTHKLLRSPFVNIKQGDFQFMSLSDCSIDINGSILLSMVFGTTAVTSAVGKAEYDRVFVTCFLPEYSNSFYMQTVKMPELWEAAYMSVTYNPFSRNEHLNMLFELTYVPEGSLDKDLMRMYMPIQLVYDPASATVVSNKAIEYVKALEYLQKENKPAKKLSAIPVKTYTNKFGLSTMISEENVMFKQKEGGRMEDHTHLGNILITQFNDKGEEVWATVLPKSQVLMNNLYPSEIAHREHEKDLFRDIPREAYANQFASVTSFGSKNDIYVMYNDVTSNFNKTVGSSIDTVYTYEHANAVFYKLGKKRELVKEYLFGEPGNGVSIANMIESAAFNEGKGEYATLVLKRNGEEVKTHISWCYFDK